MINFELKPCPFCGSNRIAVDLDSMYGDTVQCDNCGAMIVTEATKIPSALALWNRRAYDVAEKIAEGIEAAIEENALTEYHRGYGDALLR